MTLTPEGGAAIPVSVTTTRRVQGGAAIPVYGYMTAPTDGRPAMGGAAIPVRVLAAADLKQNGGQWTLEGRPHAMPVYTAPTGVQVQGGPALAVYPVNAWPTVPVVPAWVPTDIAGLKLWLKADAGLYKDAAKAQPVTADADAIYTWADQSGNGNDAVQATAAARPLYKVNIQNGKPVARFDGTDDFMRATFTLNQPYSVVLIANQVTYINNAQMVGGVGANVAIYNPTPSPKIAIYAGSSVGAIDLPVNAFAIVQGIFNGASSYLYVNTTTSGAVDPGAGNPGGVTIACSSLGFANTQIDVGEMMVYNVALTAGNLTNLRTYANTRWAVY